MKNMLMWGRGLILCAVASRSSFKTGGVTVWKTSSHLVLCDPSNQVSTYTARRKLHVSADFILSPSYYRPFHRKTWMWRNVCGEKGKTNWGFCINTHTHTQYTKEARELFYLMVGTLMVWFSMLGFMFMKQNKDRNNREKWGSDTNYDLYHW